jgi:hypothetical protein
MLAILSPHSANRHDARCGESQSTRYDAEGKLRKAALQIAACNASWSRESTWNIGLLVMLLGIAALVYVDRSEK